MGVSQGVAVDDADVDATPPRQKEFSLDGDAIAVDVAAKGAGCVGCCPE